MKSRVAFTLFELILAVALSATLLALIGTAVNLYLVRMDSGRTRVEEAQLARSILSTIAADIRATTVYQTQDISTASQLAKAAKKFDPDAIDSGGAFSDSSLGGTGLGGSGGSSTSAGTGGSSSSTSGSSGASSTSGSSTDGGLASSTTTMTPGLNGLANELTIDVARLPRLDELFPAVPQQASTAAAATAAANAPRPSDLKSIHYVIRQGTAIDPSDAAASAISPDAQQGVGGLVRQVIDRAVFDAAEQSANSQLLNSGQVLLAPEVTQIQFVYFDGSAAADTWDMQERSSLPTAVEVRVWIAPDATEAASSEVTLQPRMYSETVELPLAAAAQAAASASGSQQSQQDSTDQSTEDGSTTDDSSNFGI
jgi:hypothetical protein